MSITIRRYRYRGLQIEHQFLTAGPNTLNGMDHFIVASHDGAILSLRPTLALASQWIDEHHGANLPQPAAA